MFRWLNISLIQLLWLCPLSQAVINLPTPREHYKSFKLDPSGLALLLSSARQMHPATQQALMNLAQAVSAPISGASSQLSTPTLEKPAHPVDTNDVLVAALTQKP